MDKDLTYYMNLSYRVEVIQDNEEGGYTLHYPELAGCITCAETLMQGFANLEDAKESWIMACLEDGISIPEPSNLNDYSGQFSLNIPRSLHKALAERSRQEGISINQYCLHLLSSGANASYV